MKIMYLNGVTLNYSSNNLLLLKYLINIINRFYLLYDLVYKKYIKQHINNEILIIYNIYTLYKTIIDPNIYSNIYTK